MKRFIFAVLALFAIAAQAATVTLGNADGSEFPCGGLSRFCYNVPNTGALSIGLIYTYQNPNPYVPTNVAMDINGVPYQSAPGMSTFGPLVPAPCVESPNGTVSDCAFQAIGATFAGGVRLDMVMYTYTLHVRACSGRGCGGPRQFWFIQSGTLVMP